MGYRTSSASVKCKISVSEDIAIIYNNIYDEDLEDEDLPVVESPQGWQVEDDCFTFKKKIYATKLRKNNAEVFIVNESQYEMIGECEFSVFSDDVEALTSFISDHNLNPHNIETDTTVQQTL
jgi:hypothetical protein